MIFFQQIQPNVVLFFKDCNRYDKMQLITASRHLMSHCQVYFQTNLLCHEVLLYLHISTSSLIRLQQSMENWKLPESTHQETCKREKRWFYFPLTVWKAARLPPQGLLNAVVTYRSAGRRKVLACYYRYYQDQNVINPLTPEDFYVFEWFSAFTRPIGFRDSIFKVTIESAAVLKHWRLEFTGNVIVTLSFCFVELE